jgi:outer membrane usher protein
VKAGAGTSGSTACATARRSLDWQGSAQYNARHALLRGELDQIRRDGGTQEALRLSASGGIALLGGRLHFSRPVQDSFALVRIASLADVPVTVNGMGAGSTDARGELFIPQLASYAETHVAVDTRMVPIEYSLARVSRSVLVAERTGAVIDFEARRVQAVVGRLFAGGAPLQRALVSLRSAQLAVSTSTGPEGELYLEQLPAGSYLGAAELQGGPCRFAVEVPASDAMFLELGELRCEAG